MFKALLASTVVASSLACAAYAQEATQPTPGTDAPAATEPTTPMAPAPGGAAQDPAPGAPADGAMAPADGGMMAEEPALTPVEVGEISAEELIGAPIQTMDSQNIAQIDDVLMSPDGAVDNVVATFGGFLGFGSNTVLLSMDEIEVLQDEAGNFVVHTSLTPEALEGRPDYKAAN
jgi:hypothetical protein